MTDKELMEYAAKAAGIDYKEYLPDDDAPISDQFDIIIKSLWNPLTDDGDAFRLAVKLELEMYFGEDDGLEAVYIGHEFKKTIRFEIEDISRQDKYAATRRAIVRAAAKIGKEMP